MDRRNFMKATGAVAAASLLSGFAGKKSKQSIGVQLYTVRSLMAQDVAGTLKSVAGIGFKEVEFAGYFGKSAKEIKSILSDNGLTTPAAHMSVDQLEKGFDAYLDYASEVGHKYLFLGWLKPEDRTLARYGQVIDAMNKAALKAKKHGITVGHHNHEFEFESVDGTVPYDMFLKNTDADLVKLELDLYWCAVAGVDPVKLFKKHPGRFPAVHVKDRKDGKMVSVGTGDINFGKLLKAGKKSGVKHFFVEHDNPVDALASITQGFNHVSKLRF